MTPNYQSILPPKRRLDAIVNTWLQEDIPSFDFGMSVVGEGRVEATLYCKQQKHVLPDVASNDDSNVMVTLAGKPFVEAILRDYFQCEIEWKFQDGDVIQMNGKDKIPVATVRGTARNVLQGERIALNVLTRCAGIATMCKTLRNDADKRGYKGQLAATRKTTPGFRLVEKYGAIVGGFSPHRYDVSQVCMLKDNHIDACGGDIAKAIKTVKDMAGFTMMIEVECRSIADARKAAQNGAHILMLDNFGPEKFKESAAILKKEFPHVVIEGSGGLATNTLHNYYCDACDVLSMSFTIQGHGCVDFSMKIEKNLE